MREPAFLRQNKNKWLEYERKLFGRNSDLIDPDRLAELYVQLTDDLAYARTFYPNSPTVKYLNGLAARTHLAIYQNKKEKRSRFFGFWTTELPQIFAESRRFMLYSIGLFTIFFLIGVISTLKDPEFPDIILGSAYVNETIKNIEAGNPTGIYQQAEDKKFLMFFRIFLNNVWVSFVIFAGGILFSVGTITGIPFLAVRFAGMFQTGIMLGTFLTLFHVHNAFWEAVPIIYIHGMLEISAIVLAGGAGFMLGYSILFPGTYSRLYALTQAARRGIKIMFGLVPIFFMAALLEGYVTRMAHMHLVWKLMIVIGSLLFVIGYYFIFPFWLEHQNKQIDYGTGKDNP